MNNLMVSLVDIKSKVLSRVGWKTGAVLLAAVAAILVLTPRVNSVSQAESCDNPPDHAVLNYWPVSFDQSQTGCTDFTLLDGKIVGSGSYSLSQSDLDDGLQVADNEEVYMRIYVHNGAAQNGDPDLTTARDIEINFNVPTAASADHTITASAHGINTNTVSGSYDLHTAGSRTLEIVPNSGELFDAFGEQISSNIDVSDGHYALGTQQACFEFAVFFRFRIRTAAPAGTPALSITKQVRNVTQNNSLSSSTSANTGNTVAYQIKVKNTGTAPALNTTVIDTGTSGTTYVNGSLSVSNGGTGSGIPGTITLGTLAVNEEVTINYSATVTGGPGTYVNTATAQATGVTPIGATATVTVPPVGGNPALSITKQVRNVSQNNSFSSSTSANTGNTVAYQIKVKNIGNAPAVNTTVTDTGTSGTSFISGSLQVSNGGSGSSIPGTITLGTLAVNEEVTINYSATVTGGSGTYVNTATAQATGITPVDATATVTVSVIPTSNNAECISVSLSPSSPFNPNQSFTGTIVVRNNGTTSWVPANGYALGSQNPANNTRWGTSRINVPSTVAPGQQATFTVNTQAPSTTGTYSFAWQMVQNDAFFGAICQTPVVVNPVNPQDTTLSVTKRVRNVDNGGGFVKSVDAEEDDIVEYEVVIRNTGSVTAEDVTLRDNLTSGTDFVDDSIRIDNTSSNSDSFPGTINLGDLAVNDEFTVRYRAEVTEDDGTFINTATADASNTDSDSDTARVIVEEDNGCTSNCGNNNTRRLSITKQVRNLTAGNSSYSNTTSANDGDRVQFEITIRSTGNSRVDDVRLRDELPSGLRLNSGTIEIDGDDVSSNSLSSIDLGDMDDGDRTVVTFVATVDNNGSSCSTRSMQNIARASADNANSVEDDAFVTVGCVAGSNISLAFSKKAWNDTKNVDATTTTASREDFITYTLTVTNNGNSDATNFVITDDLSGVLPFADMVDRGGGTLSGNILSYPAMTIRAGSTVTKTFRVRVKASLSQSLTYQLQNTYGNTVTINVGSVLGSSTFTAPKTGAAGNSAAAFAGLLTLGFVAYKKRELLRRLVMA